MLMCVWVPVCANGFICTYVKCALRCVCVCEVRYLHVRVFVFSDLHVLFILWGRKARSHLGNIGTKVNCFLLLLSHMQVVKKLIVFFFFSHADSEKVRVE